MRVCEGHSNMQSALHVAASGYFVMFFAPSEESLAKAFNAALIHSPIQTSRLCSSREMEGHLDNCHWKRESAWHRGRSLGRVSCATILDRDWPMYMYNTLACAESTLEGAQVRRCSPCSMSRAVVACLSFLGTISCVDHVTT